MFIYSVRASGLKYFLLIVLTLAVLVGSIIISESEATAVFAGEDYLLCAYYHSYDTPRMLSATVIKKVMLSEIEE